MHEVSTATLILDAGRTTRHDDYDVELIQSLDGLQAVRNEWQLFLSGDVRGNTFFNDPLHIGLRLTAEPAIKPWILVLRRGGLIRCIAPFYLEPTRLGLKLSVLTFGTFSLQLLKSFGQDFIIAEDEDSTRCYKTVFEMLWQQRSGFELIAFDRMVAQTPIWQYCRARFARGGQFRFVLATPQMEKHHQLHLFSTHDAYLASLHHSTRQTLRRAVRRLCNERHARLTTITTPEQIPWFLDQLDRVYRTTWQAKTFGCRPRNTERQIRYLSSIADSGWLRSYLLENDDGPIAFDLGYQYGSIFYARETGYAQDWARFSPGAVMMYLYIEDLYRNHPPNLVDFGVGDSPHKRRLSNVEHGAAAVYLALRNRWRLILTLQCMVYGVERFARAVLTRLRLDDAVRKVLKHQG